VTVKGAIRIAARHLNMSYTPPRRGHGGAGANQPTVAMEDTMDDIALQGAQQRIGFLNR